MKMLWTVIITKIASLILEKEKSEDVLTEDFLSILKPSEITKIYYNLYGKVVPTILVISFNISLDTKTIRSWF